MVLVMEFRLKSMAHLPSCQYSFLIKRSDSKRSRPFNIVSLASKGKGFGREPAKKEKNKNVNLTKETDTAASEVRKLAPEEDKTRTREAPDLMSGIERKFSDVSDQRFNEKLAAVRRSALEQKKREENKIYQAIDYDAPIESEQGTIGIGTKVGVGIAVVVFGLVFALGDFIPSGSVGPTLQSSIVDKKLTDEEKAALQTRLRQYEATLGTTPSDPTALEGAAVTLVELGSYDRASSLLEKLTKERPDDAEAFRLLGEVKYELKDYEGSAAAYRSSLSASRSVDFDVLRGLTNALLADKKPDEAVQFLLSARQNLNTQDPNQTDGSMESQKVDPIQVELLLGKAYSDWGHVSDAVAVYDQLISAHPNDFRGYLAKGIILKENGKVGDAERMFIQARFFAPDKAKALVDQYSR
ncbi:TPR-like protein [Dioscorea alata]|uniref:TPR-like protein n=1 Tax=Dioscorea alata TaxID=55571 RepID=A0ACB7UTY1_DIOAL|nr:TPR-like protein [Dioscorea alata]